MIKVKIGKEILEFDENQIYFKKIKSVDSEYHEEISYYYIIGKNCTNTSEERIYGEVEEWPIDEAVVKSILKDFPEIEIYRETQIIQY